MKTERYFLGAPRLTEGARRRVAMLRWSSAGVAAAAAIVGLFLWMHPPDAFDAITRSTIWWCLGTCVATALMVDRFVHNPSTEGYTWVVFSTVIAFLALLVFFGATHAYYSRSTMAIAFVIDTVWLLAGVRLLVRGHVLRLGVCEPEVLHALLDARAAIAHPVSRVRADLFLTTDLAQLAKFDGVVIDRYMPKSDRLKHLLGALRLGSVRIYSVDYVHELLTGRVSLHHVEDSFLDDSSGKVLYTALKRAMDVVGALLLLAIFGLPMLVVAAAIRLTSPGPALFRQQRIGVHGTPFEMVKFRTMVDGRADPNVRQDPRKARREARRITPLGRVLRRFRIDELPQLFNVLGGSMSLIGPRPEWEETADPLFDSIDHFPYRHLVRPGITGWAQVNQGHVTAINDSRIKLEFDLYYVKHFSFALDFVICLRTMLIVLTGYGAR